MNLEGVDITIIFDTGTMHEESVILDQVAAYLPVDADTFTVIWCAGDGSAA